MLRLVWSAQELVELQPSHTETEAAAEFASLMKAVLVRLHALDKASCIRVLPTAVQLLTNYFACDNQEVSHTLIPSNISPQR
jgi:hypothetical protein